MKDKCVNTQLSCVKWSRERKEQVERDELGKPSLNQGKWENQQREQAKEDKKREAVEKAGKTQEKVFDILLVDPPWEYTLSRNGRNCPLSEGAWLKQQKEQAKEDKKREAVEKAGKTQEIWKEDV